MVFGIITAIAFLLAAAKFVTKRMHRPSLDHAAMQAHKVASLVLYVMCAIHIANVWPLRAERPVAMIVLGIVMAAAVLATLLSHIFAKRLGRKWLPVHRIAAATIAICLVFHVGIGIASAL